MRPPRWKSGFYTFFRLKNRTISHLDALALIKGPDNRRLDSYCQQEFGKTSKQLSAQDASKLIDLLKDAKENGGLAS